MGQARLGLNLPNAFLKLAVAQLRVCLPNWTQRVNV
jgi:hypothetical protein